MIVNATALTRTNRNGLLNVAATTKPANAASTPVPSQPGTRASDLAVTTTEQAANVSRLD